MNETGTVRLTQHIDASPARVWDALTDPSLLATWWAAGDVAPEVGHRFTLDMGTFGAQQCEVIAVEPERRFAYTFGEGWLDTVITWTLEPSDGGTDLTLEHSGFKLDTPMGQQAYQGMGGGWPQLLPKIEQALAE
jgi:uncharacterized protein YndB with AHSA1/START domain